MQQWMQFFAMTDSLCNLAAAAVNLAATVIKYRRERKPAGREADHRPVDAESGQRQAIVVPDPGNRTADLHPVPDCATNGTDSKAASEPLLTKKKKKKM